MTRALSFSLRWSILLLVPFLGVSGCYHVWKPLPHGVSYMGEPRPADDVRFLADLTFVDKDGVRHVEQQIFDEVFRLIREARRLVLLDMFLFNDFQGDVREETRALSDELTQLLVAQKKQFPELEVVLVTDPVNTVYGGLASPHLERLEAAGVQVVMTRLEPLRDSNPAYSSFWRLLIRPLGTGRLGAFPNPFGAGRVSFRTYLRLLNFKANHRKALVADSPDGWVGLVTSANPHDGSSAHGNIALRFSGPAVADLVETERAVIEFSGGELLAPIHINTTGPAPADTTVQLVTEGKIGVALDTALEAVTGGDELDVAVFYLSDRRTVRGLIEARRRGARVRVLLDPNKDAFGLEKNGIPNRPVAEELRAADIPVRWCDTHGEQCHTKLWLHRHRNEATLIVGSANLTRRNIRDYNLETNVVVRGPLDAPVIRDARDYFELLWSNDPERRFSADYEVYRDTASWKRWLYRFSEATGLGTH
jgi:phosphatidylserine/phosphatidylglycerophosphate/cardiolipin synthase-like enzyme